MELPAAGSEGHKLLVHTYIHGDRCRLDQVLRNLLSNALKFTPEGGTVTIKGSVTCATYRSGDGALHNRKDLLRIEVIDTGAGIAKVTYNTAVYDMTQFSIVLYSAL